MTTAGTRCISSSLSAAGTLAGSAGPRSRLCDPSELPAVSPAAALAAEPTEASSESSMRVATGVTSCVTRGLTRVEASVRGLADATAASAPPELSLAQRSAPA